MLCGPIVIPFLNVPHRSVSLVEHSGTNKQWVEKKMELRNANAQSMYTNEKLMVKLLPTLNIPGVVKLFWATTRKEDNKEYGIIAMDFVGTLDPFHPH